MLVATLRQRVAVLEGKGGTEQQANGTVAEEGSLSDDPIDRGICAYLENHPDFPVTVQKVAENSYIFGDRGIVHVAQRGEHIVVRVGGGYKSLQVFMDERALMVTREHAAALAERSLGPAAPG